MKIAVLSGKGGTGKTFVSVNLAAVAPFATYVDCDVEEPNGHLFFKPGYIDSQDISVTVPSLNKEKCIHCRKCVDFCRFNALATINDNLLVFENICHSCLGCILLCPNHALEEKRRTVGTIKEGIANTTKIFTGELNIGEASSTPIIGALLEKVAANSGTTIIDCPPGSSCSVMESIKDVDYCILVTEPTLFGMHNLEMVFELVQLFKKPFSVILNKYIDEENPTETFCIDNHIPILAKIPFCNELADMNTNGLIAADESQTYKDLFTSIFSTVSREGGAK